VTEIVSILFVLSIFIAEWIDLEVLLKVDIEASPHICRGRSN
jgi:hypothetical protein